MAYSSIAEAITRNGLAWGVDLAPLYRRDPFSGTLVDAGHRATIRTDTGAQLGVVGPSFVPLQNSEAFEWFEPFVASGDCTIETCGALRGGRRVWVQASFNATAEVLPGDTVRQLLLLAHGHDGSLSVRAGFTTIRVVCENTMLAAIHSDDSRLISIKHSSGMGEALSLLRDVLDVGRREFAATTEQLRLLARYGCDDETLKRYIREVFAPGKADDENAVKRIVENVVPLFTIGAGSDIRGVRGTLWGAYNAVTEFLTHKRGRSEDTRRDSLWFGEGAELTKRALSVGLDFARAA